MHRCLCITDIQVHIFGWLTPESCAVLARTCTTFYDEAMNIVWAKVVSFVPFTRCMPSSALRISITPQAPGIASSDTATIVSLPFRTDVELRNIHTYIRILARSFSRPTGSRSANTPTECKHSPTRISSQSVHTFAEFTTNSYLMR